MKNLLIVLFTIFTINSIAQEGNNPFKKNFCDRTYAIKVDLGYNYYKSLGNFQLEDNFFSSAIVTFYADNFFIIGENKWGNRDVGYQYDSFSFGLGYVFRLKNEFTIEPRIGTIITFFHKKEEFEDYSIGNSGYFFGLKLNKDFVLNERSRITVGLDFSYYNIDNDLNKYINSNDFLNGMISIGYKYVFKKSCSKGKKDL